MKQIRIAWTPGVHAQREAGLEVRDGCGWEADTPEHREDFAAAIASGNEICGEGTHWLEERDIDQKRQGVL